MPLFLCFSMAPKSATDSRRRLYKRVDHWASRLRVAPRSVRIQRMVNKWGSCSSNGTVTLASALLQRRRGFQDFVIVHELLHLRIRNHGRLFKAVMSVHVPSWKAHNITR
ncbi:MAG: M48 metallopeptidase family protein [Gemmatimonadaceae bacterium]